MAEAAAAHGPVTVLINNAAYDQRHEIDEVTEEFWDNNQAINLRPHFFTAQAVAPGMKAAGKGSIINFTSTSFLINHPEMPSYTAAKAGIVGLTKGLAGRLGPDGIRVNAVAPGWVITERQRDLWVTEERLAAHVAKQCIREVMQPDDIVGTCLFLASDASRMLTAQTLIVDGGYLVTGRRRRSGRLGHVELPPLAARRRRRRARREPQRRRHADRRRGRFWRRSSNATSQPPARLPTCPSSSAAWPAPVRAGSRRPT